MSKGRVEEAIEVLHDFVATMLDTRACAGPDMHLLVAPQPTHIESSGRWHWPIPADKVHPGCCTSVVTASREWWEYLSPDQMPLSQGDLIGAATVRSVTAMYWRGAWYWEIKTNQLLPSTPDAAPEEEL